MWSKVRNMFVTKEHLDDVAKELLCVSVHGVYEGERGNPVTLFGSNFLDDVSRMWVDGVRVTPAATQTFGDEERHDVWMRIDYDEIPGDMFNAVNVKAAVIGAGVKRIGNRTFAYSKVETAVLGVDVEAVGDYAFIESSVSEFVCMSKTPPSVGLDAFAGIDSNATLFVPSYAVSDYYAAGWDSYFKKIGNVEDWGGL